MKCDSQPNSTGGLICPNCGTTSDQPIDQDCSASEPVAAIKKTNKATRLKGRAAVKAWRGEDTKKRKPCGCRKQRRVTRTPEQIQEHWKKLRAK